MRTTYGTIGSATEYSLNPVSTYLNIGAKDVLFDFETRWLLLPSVSSANFDWMWNSGHGSEWRVVSSGAKLSIGTLFSTVYFGHWTTEIYEISIITTWDNSTLLDLGVDTNHGAALWDSSNGAYKRNGGYQTATDTWLRIKAR